MLLRLLVLISCCVGISAAERTPVPAVSEVAHYVSLFNQDLYGLDGKRVLHPITGAFDHPASDVARDVQQDAWFNTLVFLPFLILPQALLLYIIFKFKKRDDNRSPATFMGNHRLEIIWTAIPCVALVIVAVPMWTLLVKMESPPIDQRRDMVVEVRGHVFAWDYKYQSLGEAYPTRREDQFEIGLDAAQSQEPLVLVKGRRVILSLTSNDVNHAWWIPAFGVKKDVIIHRYTHTWFTPERTGFFKGQCAELCGQGHGIMLISALVLEEADFHVWRELQRRRADSSKIWTAITGKVVDANVLNAKIEEYLKKDDSPWRPFALRYWLANHAVSLARKPNELKPSVVQERCAQVDAVLASHNVPMHVEGN